MARTQTAETPPRRRRALAAVPDPISVLAAGGEAAAKSSRRAAAPKKAATPQSTRASKKEASPHARPSSALLTLYARYLEAKPPAKRAAANRELEKSLAGMQDELGEILLCVGPIFSFCLAALSEAVSQAYNAAGGELVPLRERYERIVAAPMRPTSRRAWAAYHAHADIDDVRTILRTIAKSDSETGVALGLAALNQALCAVYAAAEKSPE